MSEANLFNPPEPLKGQKPLSGVIPLPDLSALVAPPDCDCHAAAECAHEEPKVVCEDCGRSYRSGEIHVCGGECAQVGQDEFAERVGRLLKAAEEVCVYFEPMAPDYSRGGLLLAVLRIATQKVKECS